MRRSVPAVPILTRRLVALGAACLTLTSCDSTPSSPVVEAVGPLSLRLVAGDGQSALPGEELPNPLVVSVTDSRGHRVRGQVVNFRVVEGGGTTFAGVAITNSDGMARERWTLGMQGPQRLEARAIDENTGDAVTFGVLTATVIDVQPPVATDSVRPNPALTTDPVRLTVTISDEMAGGSQIAGASYSLDGGAFVDMQPLDGQLDSSIEVFEVVLPPFGAAGQHEVCARGRDASDNVSELACETLVVVAPPPPAALSMSPASFTYATTVIGQTSAGRIFIVTNTGGSVSGPVGMTLTGPSVGDFLLVRNLCGVGLPPGMSCSIELAFRPTVTGVRSATLGVQATPGGSASAAVSGTGAVSTSPPTTIIANPSPLGFGQVGLGASSTAPLTVVNTGAFQATGLSFAMAPPLQDFATGGGSSTCVANMTLNPGQSCVLLVNFAPQVTGLRQTALAISAANALVVNVTLSGTGLVPPALSINPLSGNFGNVPVGDSFERVFTVTNSSTATTGPLSVSVEGPPSNEFEHVTICGAALAPSGTCTVTVTFTPAVTGTRNATLVVAATPGGTVAAPLIGVGIVNNARLVLVTPALVDFGTVPVGQQSAPQPVRVGNASPLSLATVTVQVVSSPDFVVLQDNCRSGLAPGGACDVLVAFRPTTPGGKSALLTFAAAGVTSVSASLQGITP